MARKKPDLHVTRMPDESEEEAVSKVLLEPETWAGMSIDTLRNPVIHGKNGDIDLLDTLIQELQKHVSQVQGKDLSRAEAALVSQAATLDALFHNLLKRAVNADLMPHLESYMKLALKAQAQCRTTWEAVSNIQNPPVQYVKQMNLANNQQVNNGTPQAGDKTVQQTQQSGERNELRENSGTPSLEKQDDSPLEALGEVHRAENCRR